MNAGVLSSSGSVRIITAMIKITAAISWERCCRSGASLLKGQPPELDRARASITFNPDPVGVAESTHGLATRGTTWFVFGLNCSSSRKTSLWLGAVTKVFREVRQGERGL
jgi:hypothetical protein